MISFTILQLNFFPVSEKKKVSAHPVFCWKPGCWSQVLLGSKAPVLRNWDGLYSCELLQKLQRLLLFHTRGHLPVQNKGPPDFPPGSDYRRTGCQLPRKSNTSSCVVSPANTGAGTPALPAPCWHSGSHGCSTSTAEREGGQQPDSVWAQHTPEHEPLGMGRGFLELRISLLSSLV